MFTLETAATAAYVVAALLFILALAGLSRHETSRAGNTFGIVGMVVALVATIALALARHIEPLGLALLVAAMTIGAAIGLWRAKAKHIIDTCTILEKDFNGEVPADFDALTKLPGVGTKTANVVLNVAFGKPTIAVDTHIFRVANRTGIAPGKTPQDVMEKLLKTTPKEFLTNAHHWLLLHGRYCCKARKPECGACPIFDLCEYPEKTKE